MSNADDGSGARGSVIYMNHKPFYRLLLWNAFNVFRSRVAPHHLKMQSKWCHYIITFICVTMPNCYLRNYTILAKKISLRCRMGVKSGDELRHDLASVISRCPVPKVTCFHYISSSLFHVTFSSCSIFHSSADYSVLFFRFAFEKIWHSTSRNQLCSCRELNTCVRSWSNKSLNEVWLI